MCYYCYPQGQFKVARVIGLNNILTRIISLTSSSVLTIVDSGIGWPHSIYGIRQMVVLSWHVGIVSDFSLVWYIWLLSLTGLNCVLVVITLMLFICQSVSEVYSTAITVLKWMRNKSISMLAVIKVQYVNLKVLNSIIDLMIYSVRKGIKLMNRMCETDLFTE